MDNTEYDKFLSDVKEIAGSLIDIFGRAVQMYSPLVNSLIQNKSQDKLEIEQLLDNMLDCACDDRILMLYRKLCRYYYYIDPDATARFINTYREVWDSDEELFKSRYFKKIKIE